MWPLAGLYGIQRSYTDLLGWRRGASPGALLAVLRAMGAPVEGVADCPDAFRARRLELWRRPLEPVGVAWGGRPAGGWWPLRLPASLAGDRVRCSLALEGGPERDVTEGWGVPDRLREGTPAEVEGRTFVRAAIVPREPIPEGYHRLTVRAGRVRGSSLVVSAPRRVRGGSGDRTWGVFLPLYALRSSRDWGVGDLTDLAALLEWVAGLGGRVVATPPLLAAFLGEWGEGPFDPSPYAPASRLFWNELYLDVASVPEAGTGEAAELLRSGALGAEVASLREAPLVDHRRAMAAKRRVLEACARAFFARPGLPAAFRRFAGPRARDYAAFRATVERRRASWWSWPDGERGGRLPPEGGDRAAYRYHLYVQWLMSRQMAALSGRARDLGASLYLDHPLGVNPDGYDVWRERSLFALEASARAPPDPFFPGGQDWGFPPLHPERIREDGYRYPIACLRHLLRHAPVLRIDHVMGLHRLYWVPRGADASHGVYVRYRAEEWYAILALEAARHGATIVGEDLGTVPHSVRWALRRHGILRSYVLQMEVRPGAVVGRPADLPGLRRHRPRDPREALPDPPPDSLASLNTHDLPTFAGFWREADVDLRLRRGWLTPGEARRERVRRERTRRALAAFLEAGGWAGPGRVRAGGRGARHALEGALAFLAASPARIVVVNLEDLWLETAPQNVPGTVEEYPNWRRRARRRLEEVRDSPSVAGVLRRVDRLRRAPRRAPRPAPTGSPGARSPTPTVGGPPRMARRRTEASPW